MFDYLVVQKDKKIGKPFILFALISGISCYFCIIPLFLADIFVWQFQQIYFRFHKIPLLKRSDYVCVDRYNLHGLNVIQKINCVYCGYANGVIAFSKAVTNQMEIYSCAIKHSRKVEGHEHHASFYDRKKFS